MKCHVLIASLVFVFAGQSFAAPLDFTGKQGFPDLGFTSGVSSSFTDGVGSNGLSITGGPGLLVYAPDENAANQVNTGGSLALSSTIDEAGELTGGTMTITDLSGLVGGSPGTVLLEVDLDCVSFSGSALDKTIRLTGTVSGGHLENDFGGDGAAIGIIYGPADSNYDGDLNGNFGASTGSLDAFVLVPEPATLTLVGMMGLGWMRRRRNR